MNIEHDPNGAIELGGSAVYASAFAQVQARPPGERVVALTATEARLSGGLIFYAKST
jgi:hypothetical protein